MNAAILPIIRNTNPTRIVLLMGLKVRILVAQSAAFEAAFCVYPVSLGCDLLQFGNPSWITANPNGLVFPKNDTQLMLEIHNYDPFTYAGAQPTVR